MYIGILQVAYVVQSIRIIWEIWKGKPRWETGRKGSVADVILQVPKKGFASLCLEFKTPNGKQSDEQKEYQRQVEMAGSKYVVVRSVEQAIRIMQKYLR